jgi:hypothetical protein
VRELSTSRAFGPSGVKGDELAAVEFVPFDDLLALDHFADVAVDRPQGDPRRRPDVLRLFGDGYARCRLSCSGGTPRRCSARRAAYTPDAAESTSSPCRAVFLSQAPAARQPSYRGRHRRRRQTDHMLGDANDFVRDVSRIRWTAA